MQMLEMVLDAADSRRATDSLTLVFELRRRAGRAVRNPRTGSPLTIKASIVPAFRAAKALKEMVNRKR